MIFNLFKNLFASGNNNELAEIVKNGSFLVDVRTPGEFSSGSVKNAVNIPLNTITQNLKKFAGKENIVVFCQSGGRSGQAKRILEQNGITSVTNAGGLQKVRQLLDQ